MQQEVQSILAPRANSQIGSLTVGDVEKVLGDISIAYQKAAYVRRLATASFAVPGAGQFMGGNPVGGTLWLLGDLAVIGATYVGAYLLLPANVQWGAGNGTDASGLNYLDTPVAGIRTAWQANSLRSYLPSLAVMAGGMIVKHLIGFASSRSAAALARRNIADGRVTFRPELLPFVSAADGRGRMGMMMRWRY